MNGPHPSIEDMNPAGIVTRGVAAVIDLAVVAVIMASVYVGTVFVQLLFDPQSYRTLPMTDPHPIPGH